MTKRKSRDKNCNELDDEDLSKVSRFELEGPFDPRSVTPTRDVEDTCVDIEKVRNEEEEAHREDPAVNLLEGSLDLSDGVSEYRGDAMKGEPKESSIHTPVQPSLVDSHDGSESALVNAPRADSKSELAQLELRAGPTDQHVASVEPCIINESEDSSSQTPEKWDIVRKLNPKAKVVCRVQGCRRRAVECWASNLAPEDEWNMCAKCIQEDFGPDECDDDIEKTGEMNDAPSPDKAKTPSASKHNHIESTYDLPPKSSHRQDESHKCMQSTSASHLVHCISPLVEASSDAEEHWDLKKVMTYEDLSMGGAIKCGSEPCTLAAAVVYCSTLSLQKWYTCLDCQLKDFGGWPEKLKDIPISTMTTEHEKIMAQKCSKLSSPAFPKFYESRLPENNSSDEACPSSNSTQQMALGAKGKPSAQAMAIHRKWQAAAEAMGGSDARIVVDKKVAKRLIIDLLYEAFRPMNITQIHSDLKAVVPSPVLKQCLDDMTLDKEDGIFLFADSDEDESSAKNKKKFKSNCCDEFDGALGIKGGRNANTTLYFIDHTKQKNNGNGLDFDSRQKLLSEKSRAEEECSQLRNELRRIESDTQRLHSEPTNEEAMSKVEVIETALKDLLQQVEEARKLKIDEKVKKKTQLLIESMTAQWRKRRRICMDFLMSMEENSEGTISTKKCLAGDGLIDIESDEKAVKDSATFVKNKRTRTTLKSTGKTSYNRQDCSSTITANENFIGIQLDSQGKARRVFFDELKLG